MNIINRQTSDKDPFSQSDRDPIGRGAGKGDRNRSDPKKLSEGLDRIFGRRKSWWQRRDETRKTERA